MIKLLQKTISILRIINKKGGIAVPIIVLLILTTIFFRQCYHRNFYSRYTIGTPIKISFDAYLVKIVTYQYEVNGILYERNENYHGGEIGKWYYVKYSYEDPKISDFIEDKPVNDSSIKEAPPDGWGKLPE